MTAPWKDQPTPLVDNAKLQIDSDDSCCGIYTHNANGTEYAGDVCRADTARAIEQRMREGERLLSDPRQWSEDAHEWQQWSHEVDAHLAAAREMDGAR